MKYLLILIVIFSVSLVRAQEFSLYDAQTFALENAEKLSRANLDIESAEKQVVETRAMGLPQINSTMDFQNFLTIPVQVVDGEFIGQPGTLVSFRAGTDYNANAGVSLNQLIFDGSYIVGLQVSKFYTKFMETNKEKTKQDILAEVTQAYEMALISERNKAFVDTLLTVTEDLLEKQTHLFETGFITQEQLDQTEYSVARVKANAIAANVASENAKTALKMTMAYPIGDSIVLTEELDGLLEDQMKDLSGSIEENIQLDLLRQQRELSEYDYKNMKMNNLPRLSGFFNHQYNAYRNEFNFFDSNEEWYEQTVVGIQLNIPIFSSGERWAKMQKAKIAIKQDELNIQEMERNLKGQEVRLKNDLRSARAQLALKKKNVTLARKIYDNALVRAEIGKENSIEVTQKYNQLIGAQSEYVNAMMEVFKTKVDLDELYNQLIRE